MRRINNPQYTVLEKEDDERNEPIHDGVRHIHFDIRPAIQNDVGY